MNTLPDDCKRRRNRTRTTWTRVVEKIFTDLNIVLHGWLKAQDGAARRRVADTATPEGAIAFKKVPKIAIILHEIALYMFYITFAFDIMFNHYNMLCLT